MLRSSVFNNMGVLYIQFFILAFMILSSKCDTSTQKQQLLLLENKMLQQNVKIEELHSRIAEQDIKIAQQDARIAGQETKIAEEKLVNYELKRKLELGSNNEEQNEAASQTISGAIYTRWGRTDCADNVSSIVYSGVVGGSYYTHTGAAVDYLCLPLDPLWDVNQHFSGPHWGYIYGNEYEDMPQPNLKNYAAPCAVCRSSGVSTVIMIPGRNQCYPGWQEAYHGELVTGYFAHKAASEYICLDSEPQTHGNNSNKEGKIILPVKAKCGSLPCPPYRENKLISCVVCLK